MNPNRYGEAKAEPGFGRRRRRRSVPREKFSAPTPQDVSDEQEKRVARRMGGERVAASGAGRVPTGAGGYVPPIRVGRKGDVSLDVALVECKTTMKGSISIKREYLVKIAGEARDVHKTPAVAVSFHAMPDGVDRDWLLVPMRLWERVRDKSFTPMKVKIRKGWMGEGRELTAIGSPVWDGQWWVPVLDPDEEDPTFHKTSGLEGYEGWADRLPPDERPKGDIIEA